MQKQWNNDYADNSSNKHVKIFLKSKKYMISVFSQLCSPDKEWHTFKIYKKPTCSLDSFAWDNSNEYMYLQQMFFNSLPNDKLLD